MNDFRYYRPNNTPPIVINLIIINVIVFLAQQLFQANFHLSEKLALNPIIPKQLAEILKTQYPGLYDPFQPYQVFTHMFSHGSFAHIVFNMFGLFMFGRILENFWGPKRFLLFYFACGIGAAALHLLVQYFRSEFLLQALLNNDADMAAKYVGSLAGAVGASGAIMGIFVAFGYLFPNTELYLMFIPIPVKAKWAVLIFVGIDLFGGVSSIRGDNIAHFAHLGGALVGFLMVLYWNKRNRKTFY